MKPLLTKPLISILALYCLTVLVLDYAGIDVWVAKKLFEYEGMAWSLKHYWFTEGLIHKGGRILNYLGVLVVLLVTAYWHIKKQTPYQILAIHRLCLSLLLSFISVNYLKSITNIDCPWDLMMFGGDMPYTHLLSDKPDQLPLSRCFPAGHASAGYAWIALYYFFNVTKPSWKIGGLIIGLVFGLLFGFAQQLRGAHFISHDLTTLFICWVMPYLVFNYSKIKLTEKHKVAVQ